MTDQATRVVPAGWYQDPATPEQVRWWNGLAWTEHVREKPGAQASSAGAQDVIRTTSTDAGATAQATVTETTEQRIAAARELERQFGIGTSENEIIRTAASAAPASAGSASAAPAGIAAPAAQNVLGTATTNPSARRAADHRAAGRASTGSAWLIALSPILTLVLAIAAAYIYFYVLATPIVFLVAFAVPYLLCLLWALGDGRALSSRGFTPPSPAWALLGAIGYLIARRLKVSGSGPLVMFLVVGVLVVGTPPLLGATGQLAPLSFALQIQSTISTDYLTHGKAVQVNCPPFVDAATTGTLYTCDATLATGVHKTIWVSIDGDNGKFSYSFGL